MIFVTRGFGAKFYRLGSLLAPTSRKTHWASVSASTSLCIGSQMPVPNDDDDDDDDDDDIWCCLITSLLCFYVLQTKFAVHI